MPSSLVKRMRTSLLLQLLAAQNVQIVLGKAMGLIAHVLQQTQSGRVPAQTQGFALPGPVNLLLPLGQREQDGRLDIHDTKRLQCGVQLTEAAIDEQNVRKNMLLIRKPAKTPRHHLADRGEIVN